MRSSEAGVPPYVIFHDAVLRAMASERPASRDRIRDARSSVNLGHAGCAKHCLKLIRKFTEQYCPTALARHDRCELAEVQALTSASCK